jgi:hypothetical protein
MKKIATLSVVLFFLLALLLGFMVLTSERSFGEDTAYTAAEPTTHRIQIRDMFLTAPDDACSATAIGPYALLTAGHCVENGNEIFVDGKSAKIMVVLNDGHDHAILLLDGMKFEKFAEVKQRPLQPSEDLFIIGNPRGYTRQYRRGYVMGTSLMHVDLPPDDKKNIQFYVMDINGFYGDSGSGIFDKSGKLVCVFSTRKEIKAIQEDITPAIVAGAFELAFTEDQLSMAKDRK